jgi:hypothetical protein
LIIPYISFVLFSSVAVVSKIYISIYYTNIFIHSTTPHLFYAVNRHPKKNLPRRLQVYPLIIDQPRIARAHTARAQAVVRGTGRVDPLRTSRTRSKTRLQSTRGGNCLGPCMSFRHKVFRPRHVRLSYANAALENMRLMAPRAGGDHDTRSISILNHRVMTPLRPPTALPSQPCRQPWRSSRRCLC